MKSVKIQNIRYENTLKAFQQFYDVPLTRDDAIRIKNNLMGVCKILNENKRKLRK